MISMQHIAWVFASFPLLFITTPAAASSQLLFDMQFLGQQLLEDSADMQAEQNEDDLEQSDQLFALPEDTESTEYVVPEYTPDPEPIVITVDGKEVTLSDVKQDEWFADYVATVASKNLISGYRDAAGNPLGTFGPSDSITLEQLAKIAVHAAGLDPLTCSGPDSAKLSSRWSHIYIACAKNMQWAVFEALDLELTRPVLRSEVVVTVLQAFNVRITPVTGTVFTDVNRLTEYGNAIETAADHGLVSGYSDLDGNSTGYFGVLDRVNRAQAAKIFAEALALYAG